MINKQQQLNISHYQYIYTVYYKWLCLKYLQNLSSVFCHPSSGIADYPTLTDETFTYDANGSQIEEKNANGQLEKQYLYNTENRLSEIKDSVGQTIASYYCDPFGRRLSKTVTNPDATTTTTYFHYNDEGYSAEKTSGQIISYLFSPKNIWSISPQFKRVNNIYYYYQNDHLGTPNILHDKQGQVVNAREMKAFGEWTNSTDTINDNFAFAGQYKDVELGKYYNYFRYYDPIIGRYFVNDRISLTGGINIYIYALNNTKKNIDSYGLYVIPAPGCNGFDCPGHWSPPPSPAPGTCGPSSNHMIEFLVPDYPLGFNFSPCCQDHDDCYSTCEIEKSTCDDDFRNCMSDKCLDFSSMQMAIFSLVVSPLCFGLSDLYYNKVDEDGDQAYDDAQNDARCCDS